MTLTNKIQYCSDLHLDMSINAMFVEDNPITVFGNILIIAGDLIQLDGLSNEYLKKIITKLCRGFEKVFWLPGNHEYYDFIHRRTDAISLYEKPFKEIDNLMLIDNYSEIFNRRKLIFSTMWSKIEPENELAIRRGLNDFYKIRIIDNVSDKDRKLSVEDFNELHQLGFDFIKRQVQTALSEKEKGKIDDIIVITHHVPTLQYFNQKFLNSPLNNAFAVELEQYIETSGIDYWIHGHNHFNHPPFSIGKTKILCNQLGYVRYGENMGFKWDATI